MYSSTNAILAFVAPQSPRFMQRSDDITNVPCVGSRCVASFALATDMPDQIFPLDIFYHLPTHPRDIRRNEIIPNISGNYPGPPEKMGTTPAPPRESPSKRKARPA